MSRARGSSVAVKVEETKKMCWDTQEDSCLVTSLTYFPGILCCLPCVRAFWYSKKLKEAEVDRGIVISVRLRLRAWGRARRARGGGGVMA